MATPKQIFIVAVIAIMGILIVMALGQPGAGKNTNNSSTLNSTTIFIYGNGNTTNTTIMKTTTTTIPIEKTVPPPGGRIYVLSGANITILNSTTGYNTLQFSMSGVSPQNIALSQDYGTLFVADDSTGAVYGINTTTYDVRGVATVGAPGLITDGVAGLLATSKTYPELYELNSSIDLVRTYNLSSPGWRAVASPASGIIYVTNPRSDTVTVINVNGAGSNLTSTINVGVDPTGLTITPSGAYLLVSNSGSDSISIINTSTETLVSTINLTAGSEPTNITISPDGQAAFIADTGGATVTMLILSELPYPAVYDIRVGQYPTDLAISPSGGYLYVTSPSTNRINVIVANFTNNSYPHIIQNFSIHNFHGIAVS